MVKQAKTKARRTSAGLRDVLFDELDRLTNGDSNPQQAQAVAKLATQIINSVKAEIEFHSHVRGLSDNEDAPLGKTLVLGSK